MVVVSGCFSAFMWLGIISLLYKMNVAYLAWYASCIVLCVACLISLGTWNFEILIMLAFGAERKTMFCFLGIFHMYALLMQGSFTGPRIFWSGSSLRPEATGYGLVISIFNSHSGCMVRCENMSDYVWNVLLLHGSLPFSFLFCMRYPFTAGPINFLCISLFNKKKRAISKHYCLWPHIS